MVRIHLSTVLKGYQAEMRPGIKPISNSSVVEHPLWGKARVRESNRYG